MSRFEHKAADRWRYAAPVIVAIAMLALWQALTVAYDVPVYLVPSPLVVAATLVTDWSLLVASLGVTVSIALYALAIAVALGVAISLVFGFITRKVSRKRCSSRLPSSRRMLATLTSGFCMPSLRPAQPPRAVSPSMATASPARRRREGFSMAFSPWA